MKRQLFTRLRERYSCGLVTTMLDCDIIVSEFELQSHFQTNILRVDMNPHVPTAMGQIVLFMFFYKEGFGIR